MIEGVREFGILVAVAVGKVICMLPLNLLPE